MPRSARPSAAGGYDRLSNRSRNRSRALPHVALAFRPQHLARSIGGVFLCALVVLVGSTPAPAQSDAAAAAPAERSLDDLARPFFARYCQECHGGAKPKGDFRVDQLGARFDDEEVRERWETVRDRVTAGTMPPKSKPRPPAQEVEALAGWIGRGIEAARVADRAAHGRVVLRRLNRVEYENTVRDLLGVDSRLRDLLPADAAANGFDNNGNALHLSSYLLERYLEAAETALSHAITNRTKPPASTTKRSRLTELHPVRLTNQEEYRKVYRREEDGAVVLFSSSEWLTVGLSSFYPTERGRYRFRISVRAIQSGGRPVVYRVLCGGGGMGGAKPRLVGYFDAPADAPEVLEFADTMEPRTSISILPYGLPGARAVAQVGADVYDGPGLSVDWMEVEGPLNDTWPPESHRRIFGDQPQGPAPNSTSRDRVEVISADPPADADRILRGFLRRAYRRPVTDGDLEPFLKLVAATHAETGSFEQAMRTGLAAVLTAPEFLFLREAPGPLDDCALASRLSYFLWSSMPDDELLALAEQHALRQPGVLQAQVERMLDHPKAAAFVVNFVGQWLGLRDIDFTEPSRILYPDYDEMLKASMVRETELFFTEVLKNDLSLMNFVASDFSMLNGRLARHYGIPGVEEGWAFHKVALPPGSHRGGVLTMASVLKVTANGTSTSPVLRGAWVLDRILGTPPPRPPENVAALEPDIRGATTIREQLARHRQVESCASCHDRIDPPGFALESFDVIGGWRDHYRTTGRGKPVTVDGRRVSYLQGPKVDPAGVLPDGRAFADSDELKQRLLADPDMIARALTTKLLTYATGEAPQAEAADAADIDAIVARIRAHDFGFRRLIHEIVVSALFQTK